MQEPEQAASRSKLVDTLNVMQWRQHLHG